MYLLNQGFNIELITKKEKTTTKSFYNKLWSLTYGIDIHNKIDNTKQSKINTFFRK